MGFKHKHRLQLLGNDANEETARIKFIQSFVPKLVLCQDVG